MFKKSFYKFDKEWRRYGVISEGRSNNCGLDNVILTLSPREGFSVNIHKISNADIISIWSSDDIKKPMRIRFKTKEEQEKFERAYDAYYDMRYKDIACIKMSVQNYEMLQQKWEKIKEEKPEYLIFTLDDSGELDVVDIVGKNELSMQDLHDMQREHQEYLRWQKAQKLFYQDYPGLDDFWRSSADDEFQADIEKYLDRNIGFLPDKICTKKDIGYELKKMVERREYLVLIGHAVWICYLGTIIIDKDEHFNDLLSRLGSMQDDEIFELTYEQLDKIADMIIAGKDDQIDISKL